CRPDSGRPRLLHRKLGLEACDVAIDRGDGEYAAVALVLQQAILSRDVAVDGDLVPFLGVADIVDRHVVVLAPEKRHRMERLALAKHVSRGGLALALGDHPTFDANGLEGTRIGPARAIARRIDAGYAGLQIGVDGDAAIDRQP